MDIDTISTFIDSGCIVTPTRAQLDVLGVREAWPGADPVRSGTPS